MRSDGPNFVYLRLLWAKEDSFPCPLFSFSISLHINLGPVRSNESPLFNKKLNIRFRYNIQGSGFTVFSYRLFWSILLSFLSFVMHEDNFWVDCNPNKQNILWRFGWVGLHDCGRHFLRWAIKVFKVFPIQLHLALLPPYRLRSTSWRFLMMSLSSRIFLVLRNEFFVGPFTPLVSSKIVTSLNIYFSHSQSVCGCPKFLIYSIWGLGNWLP